MRYFLILFTVVSFGQFNPIFFNHGSVRPVSGSISYYKLENNALDANGTNNATVANITYATGLVSTAASFNGVNSQIFSSSSSFAIFGSTNFSVSAAVKISSMPGVGLVYHPIMIANSAVGATYDKGFRIFADGSVGFYCYDGAVKVALSSAGALTTGVWYVLTGVFDGANIKLYIGNTLVSTVACAGSNNTPTPMFVMSHIGSGGTAYNGLIDEVSIFNRALTTYDINSINLNYTNNKHLF